MAQPVQKPVFENVVIATCDLAYGNVLEISHVKDSTGRQGVSFGRKTKYGYKAGSGVLTPDQLEACGTALLLGAEEARKLIGASVAAVAVPAPAVEAAAPVAEVVSLTDKVKAQAKSKKK